MDRDKHAFKLFFSQNWAEKFLVLYQQINTKKSLKIFHTFSLQECEFLVNVKLKSHFLFKIQKLRGDFCRKKLFPWGRENPPR